MTSCRLCDLPTPDPPVTDEAVDGEFCCRGCLEVYRMLGDVDPEEVGADALTADDEQTAVPDDAVTVHLDVQGMHCATCEAFLEATAATHEGVYDADASYTTDMIELRYDENVDETELVDAVSGLGYRATLAAEEDERSRDGHEFARMRVFLALFLGMATMGMYALFLYPAYLGIRWSGLLSTPSAAISLFGPVVAVTTLELLVVGYPILRGAYVALRTGHLNMDVLIALGALVPYVYSLVAYFGLGSDVVYFDVTTTVVTVVTVGNYVEATFKRRAVGGLTDVTRTRVSEARRLTPDGETERVAVDECAPGDRLLVETDERVPVDGEVVEGTATVDESLLTGESHPRTKRPSDPVVGGSLVTTGSLTVAVGAEAQSTLDRIVEAMWHVQSGRAGVQRLADRAASVFVPLVILLAAVTTVVWFGFGAPVRAAVLTGTAVLVVSCPCSLGLATPLALVAGVRAAYERDVAVLHAETFESLLDADVVAFDKTGTLTTGRMHVLDVVADDAEAVLARAAAVESASSHPAARAIRDAADGEIPVASDTGVAGRERGVVGTVQGVRVTVGHPSLFGDREKWKPAYRDAVERATEEGRLPVVVGWKDAVHGVLLVDDTPRDGWSELLTRLHEDGRRVVLVTGDDDSRTGQFAAHPAVDDVFAEVPPEAKVEVVRRLRDEGTTVMVGDGTNDAPALAAADLGLAFASGTDVAVEAADAVITTDSLDPVVDAFEVATTTRARVRQNLTWAFGYNAVALPLAAVGLVNPLIASLAMAASSVIVVSNSARRYVGDAEDGRKEGRGEETPETTDGSDVPDATPHGGSQAG